VPERVNGSGFPQTIPVPPAVKIGFNPSPRVRRPFAKRTFHSAAANE
jgi:hypothetical protein